MFIAILCFCIGIPQAAFREVFKQTVSNQTQRIMKFWKPFLLGLWVVILILLLVFYIIPQEEALKSDTIEKLEKANKALELKNETLDTEITNLKTQADSLSGRISKSTQTIRKLENELDEKINRINVMSTMDLQSYFARFKADSTGHQ